MKRWMTVLPGCAVVVGVGLSLFVGAGYLAGCASGKDATPEIYAGAQGPVELLILHTNDLHGKYTTTEATWTDDNRPVGGFQNLSAYVEDFREGELPVLFLDGGDCMTGNPICDYDYDGPAGKTVKGGAMLEFMNLMEYDAMTLGNHEFDHGWRNIDGLVAVAEFPVLAANTFRPPSDADAGRPFTEPIERTGENGPYRIFERGGLRIGVIGLMTESLYGVAAPKQLDGTGIGSMVEAARTHVATLDPQTDLIILLTHIGVDGDRVLAREVANIDMIVGGHSHTRLRNGVVENGVLIVQAGAHNRNLGHVRLTVENDAITAQEAELITLWPREGGDPDVVSYVNEWETKIDADFGMTIGTLATAWSRSGGGETNIGNYLTDALRVHTGADFAVLNSGGIRSDVPAGPVTRLHIQQVLPFSNAVTTFSCTGQQLLDLIHKNTSAAADGRYGILQMSGVRFEYAETDGGVEIVSLLVGGVPIDVGATYRGASVDYVSEGNAEKYLGFTPADHELEGTVIATVVMDAIERAGTVDARVDGRMKRLEAVPAGQ